MKFINIFLDRPRILFLTLAFILLSGISSVSTLPIQENPELAERWATVTISYPGATPERIETQINSEAADYRFRNGCILTLTENTTYFDYTYILTKNHSNLLAQVFSGTSA